MYQAENVDTGSPARHKPDLQNDFLNMYFDNLFRDGHDLTGMSQVE